MKLACGAHEPGLSRQPSGSCSIEEPSDGMMRFGGLFMNGAHVASVQARELAP